MICTGILYWISNKLYLQWTIWWIDIILHLFGGLFVCFIFFGIYSLFFDLKLIHRTKLLFIALLSTFAIGTLWEVYELNSGITSLSSSIYYFDTSKDLLMDLVGGIVGFVYTSNFLKKLNNK